MDASFTCPRDRHLFSAGKKRILSLDGGGVRGAISIAFLERIENLLVEIVGRSVLLCDYFDLVGGTSTGAIIAAGLATGFSAGEMHAFYEKLAPKVFRSSIFHIPGWRANFDGAALHEELDKTFSHCSLGSEILRTGLCMVLKRLDTGSCWIVMNNPRSMFWETPNDNSFVGNSYLSLPDIIRASTAAPFYFDPQTIEIVKGMDPGLFLDGGLTPHNNPSLALFLTAVLPPYRLEWKTGVEDLFIVSIGTGSCRPKLTTREAQRSPAILLAINALAAQISDNQELTLMLMSWLGESSLPWPINSEIGDLKDSTPPSASFFATIAMT
ncbi:patatin-like phospholipase family protein [Methylocystis sp. IM2]|uniref:patatin-like phospholipase family protein n=1 Tax=Methylocystis sp. IM2 TaxID=3136563 RepID=UPI0030F7E83F